MPGPFSLYQELIATNTSSIGARTDPYVREVNGTDKVRIAYGSQALVSGAATVKTGLNSVIGFQATVLGTATGFAAGATEVSSIIVSGATGPIATGDVAVLGVWVGVTTGAAKISTSGTTTFYWLAAGL
jgi:hypothetical protein